MKRALTVLAFSVCLAANLKAQALIDPTANLKAYAAKVLPQCPAGVLTLQPASAANGPANLEIYVAKLTSSDQYCGTQRHIAYSRKSGQVIVGSVIPLPEDGRPANVRIAEQASKLLGEKLSATVSPFPLPDGVKAVNISRATPWGTFNYYAFLDQSERFMIVGFRGLLNSDPQKSLRESLGTSKAARRGSAASKVEILEISDFQCPTCAHAHGIVEPLIKKNLGRMNYLRLDLPLFEHHDWAMPAAMGARAIQRVAPNKYWDYVDFVFGNQEVLNTKKDKYDAFLKDYCADHDIDWAAVQKIYASPTERQALLDQVSRAFALGIASTPTYVVNGQVMGFGPEGEFTVAAIRNALGLPPAPAVTKKPAK